MARGEKTKMLWQNPIYRQKMIEAAKNRPSVSLITRKKLSDSAKRLGLRPPSALGVKMSKEFGEAIRLRQLGRKLSEETKQKIRETKRANPYYPPKGEKHHSWRGDSVKYTTLHSWINNRKGKAFFCENPNCLKKSKTYEWANKSGEYKRDFSDWMSLCHSCHMKFDDIRGKSERYKEICPPSQKKLINQNDLHHQTSGNKIS
jgi:hypothetical protein